MIGLSATVLLWFISYLKNRYFSIKIYNEYLSKKLLSHGVPQGSLLGPILFSIYLFSLNENFHQFPDINYHLYADDLQIYIEMSLHDLHIRMIYMIYIFKHYPTSDNYSLLNCYNTSNNWF